MPHDDCGKKEDDETDDWAYLDVVGTARCAVTARVERAAHALYNVRPRRLRR
jgi:hypothetical protein